MQNREKKLEQTIAKLEEEFDKSNLSDKQLTNLERQLAEQKSELETIIEFRTKGAILRSKTKWYNEGEKNTKYFLNLEKPHFKQGTINQVKISDNDFVTSDENILKECVSFYKNLYGARRTLCSPHERTDSLSMRMTESFATLK